MFNSVLKFLNIIALFVLVTLLFAYHAKAEEPQVWHHCQIKTNDVGNFRYRGVTMEDAMMKTTDACLQARLKLHKKVKGVEADDDRYTLYVLECANGNVCWRK